jgi:hypothetical protein
MSRNLAYIILIFIVVGCSQAPLIIGYTLDQNSIGNGERTVKINGLFRDGRYCVTIYLIDNNASIAWEMSDLKRYKIPENIDVKYKVEIPAIEYVQEASFLSSSDYYLIAAYNERMSYQEFTLEITDIPTYRSEIYIDITYSGNELQLSKLSYRVSVSEWACK